MSEPKSRARSIRTIVPGILHWMLRDDRIRFRSDAHAVRHDGLTVLIDPLPLQNRLIGRLGEVGAICLTGSFHQRSAWRFRSRFGVKVYAPVGARGLEERPDRLYRHGDRLPGGLRAVHAPGPTEVHYALHLARGRGALFCADALMHFGKAVQFIPDRYQNEPERTRLSVKRFLKLRFSILCFNHGSPLRQGARAAIRSALVADRKDG